jgi:hypothetical protein
MFVLLIENDYRWNAALETYIRILETRCEGTVNCRCVENRILSAFFWHIEMKTITNVAPQQAYSWMMISKAISF